MSFWSFVDRVGKSLGKIGEKFGGVLRTLGIQPLFEQVQGLLGQVQGFGKSFQGLLETAKELFKKPRDLLNPKKLLAALESTGLLGSLKNVRRMVEQILSGVGGREALSPEEHHNLVRASQASVWSVALRQSP